MRPHQSPRRSDPVTVERALALQGTQRLTYERMGLSRSTVARACQAAGLARLLPLQQRPACPREERSSAGELLHLDVMKLGRLSRHGHRVTG